MIRDSHNFLKKYMSECIEYPNPTIDDLAPGTMFSYVSSTFLNGYIPYLKPVAAYVIHRYHGSDKDESPDDVDKAVDAFHKDPGYHTNLACFKDDVIMLTRAGSGFFWYFWFDNDVSDCQIGILETKNCEIDSQNNIIDRTDTDDVVIAAFHEYAQQMGLIMSNGYLNKELSAIPLDVTKISGWISF